MTWSQLPLFEDIAEERRRFPVLVKSSDDAYTVRFEVAFSPSEQRAMTKIECRHFDDHLVTWSLDPAVQYDRLGELLEHLRVRFAEVLIEVTELSEPF